MYACVRALIFGEDFTSDPVSKGVGMALHYFSGGRFALNVPLLSQVCVGCRNFKRLASAVWSTMTNFSESCSLSLES